jgi:putative phosphotransacetylase
MTQAAGGGTRRLRLGEILVERGALRPEQVERVLARQDERRRQGVPARFGETCVRFGWAEAGAVTDALSQQVRWVLEHEHAGAALADMGAASRRELAHAGVGPESAGEELAEAALAMGLATPEELWLAEQLALERRSAAVRMRTWSSFAPFNVMELLVADEVGAALARDGGCTCSECWANVTALALNNLGPRYVTEASRVPVHLPRYEADFRAQVSERVARAVAQVRANPKTSCSSRFSDEILSAREAETAPQEVMARVSVRHVHLSSEALAKLFGAGHELRKLRDLVQPGQFAAEETVALVGPKGRIDKVRVLGPVRKQTQVEISGTDQFTLGTQAPVRESGALDGTPGITLVGPAGEMELASGLIRAQRHVHMLPEEAERMGLRNGARAAVRLDGDRPMILEGVLVRATDTSALEMHIDTDEANAAGVPAESKGAILLPKGPPAPKRV